jgi:hypothetical protein
MSENSVKGAASKLTRPQFFRFLSVGNLKTKAYSALIENQEAHTNAIFMLIESFATALRWSKG